MGAEREFLVVVADPDRFADAIEQCRRSAVVTQLLPPRLAVLRSDPESAAAPPGTSWYGDQIPADVLSTLSPTERIFVAAWQDRPVHKQRRGDGAAWDAPGFRPPDWPGRPPPDNDR
ncbi:MAG TPA: hypothetical protein VFO77_01830 [Actinoplanes sp.]|nr:hypothetical protein [Actinoplanes sp.]